MSGRRGGLKQLRDIESIWKRDLDQIHTSYGRLIYLAALCDPNTGRYQHYGADESKSSEANKRLKRVHETIFKDWIAFPLERKMTDVESYIAGLERIDPAQLIDAWLRLTPYKNLVPASIQGPERQIHISDFEAILGLLRNVYGVASPDPAA